MSLVIDKDRMQEKSISLASLIDSFCESLSDITLAEIDMAVKLIIETIENHGCVFVCGNGGSGSNANLFVSAMAKKLNLNRTALHIVSLNADMSAVTLMAERGGYEKVFSSQLEKTGKAEDLLITISGSGNSPNILEAVKTAKKLGMKNIGLTGMGGGKLSVAADLPIVVESDNMEEIESVHTVILYAVAECAAKSLFKI